ncbi:hypothetical protein D6851_06450 [Altericroceibacterium spongiae]|uniref:Uncharacterized protein n=1 Tax=Altericroceibacterium spongiae TaxID=2320269 RepID=A0A420ELW5_9SPHN|nr:hypothetical protein [Altericroceibacterium spongiae]RKF21673.1 hypothetical protein D6851_06450 [Altericroceibacterium spongiae]
MKRSSVSRIKAKSKAELKKRRKRMGLRKRLAMDTDRDAPVSGLSPNPATNLMIADIATRAASRIFRRGVEKNLLRKHYTKAERQAILDERSLGETLTSVIVARIATKSLPGAMIVGGGLAAKALVDRSLSRRQARRRGDQQLLGKKTKR